MLAQGNAGRALGHAWDAAARAATNDDQETLQAVEALAGEIDDDDARRLVAYCAACIADLRAGIQYESPMRKLFKRQ